MSEENEASHEQIIKNVIEVAKLPLQDILFIAIDEDGFLYQGASIDPSHRDQLIETLKRMIDKVRFGECDKSEEQLVDWYGLSNGLYDDHQISNGVHYG